MPQRSFSRDQVFLLPPSLDDWLAADHPARFVAVWLDELTEADWDALGIDRDPARKGEKRYAPGALLAIWVYGFMVGIRSSRALEAACRDQVPFRWLSGNQQPDHNTLARFYQRHRGQLRHLFQRSVQTAVHAGLVDWALQAVDGTKIAANAASDRMLTAAQLDALAAKVRTRADDHGILETLIDQATALTGTPAAVTVADAGYHDGAMLKTCAERELVVVIPIPRNPAAASPYHGDQFIHDPETNTLTCPQGKTLAHWGQTTTRAGEVADRYGGRTGDCQPCPVKRLCAKEAKRSRVVIRPQSQPARMAHTDWMATDDAQHVRKQRGGLVENVFGTLKTRHQARQWLLRGHDAVRAEWTMLALAYNLRTLWACSQRTRPSSASSG